MEYIILKSDLENILKKCFDSNEHTSVSLLNPADSPVGKCVSHNNILKMTIKTYKPHSEISSEEGEGSVLSINHNYYTASRYMVKSEET